jgi:hypothetical protein
MTINHVLVIQNPFRCGAEPLLETHCIVQIAANTMDRSSNLINPLEKSLVPTSGQVDTLPAREPSGAVF